MQNIKTKLKENQQLITAWRTLRRISKKIIRLPLFIIGYLMIIPVSYLTPKKNYVVLTTRFGDFEGNLKYFFLYLNNLEEQDWEFVFLTEKKEVYRQLKDKGFQVWFYPGLFTILKLFRTRILIVDGNEWAKNLKYFFLFSAKKVQLWHGTGLKTIGLLKPAIKNLSRFRQMLKKEYTYYDLLVLTSEYQVKMRSKAFRYGKLLVNGYPRNDIFFKETDFDYSLGSDYSLIEKCRQYKNEGFSLVTYTPTWRKFDHSLHLDLDSLDDFAGKNSIKFIIKLHYKHDCSPEVSRHKNIIEYDKYTDVYPLLAVTDLLITDYSSIYLDYLLLEKPIIFFPYDIDEYTDNERQLLIDFGQVTPGPKVYSQEELNKELHAHIVEGKDWYNLQREEQRKKFFKYRDGKSSERLWSAVKKDML